MLKIREKAVAAGIAVVIVFINGCGLPAPGVRLGSYATATPGTRFLDMKNLGRHWYGSSWFEKNGIVYTCRGGHIDMAHARIAADNTRYIQDKAKRALRDKGRDFDFKLKVEPSRYYVHLEYPLKWNKFSRKKRQKAIEEVSLEMGEYLTFMMTTWHEVLTYFGFKSMAFIPEQPSAFSWEDVYSNVFGIRIGAQAIQDKSHDYDTAATTAFKRELENMGIQSRSTAWKASEKMRGTWYRGLVLVDMKGRNFDVGLDDGTVTPMLVPGVCPDAEPLPLPAPTLEKCKKYGFEIDLRVEPKEFERERILKVIYGDKGAPEKIKPAEHLGVIIEYLKKDMEKKQK